VAGRVLYDSASSFSLSPQSRQLGYVFQDYALFPHLTVRQNIAFGLRRGWLNPARSFSDAAVERWIGTFHLEPVAGHYPHQLSGGQCNARRWRACSSMTPPRCCSTSPLRRSTRRCATGCARN
jgi:ABC-type sulfate/molybdate transport systems ATPase subunit